MTSFNVIKFLLLSGHSYESQSHEGNELPSETYIWFLGSYSNGRFILNRLYVKFKNISRQFGIKF